ncbi:hypothetical protein [Kineosporia babensis]|uniref:Uncharacterized protein n=1 Tax=Kineosporia babensis TaxID=499548 RepID=A0A9X1NLJ7_9ACTN|nr:hypothetical protein [Kineosporia babensis]MCD5317192.1 hypothetical protein [Kineosporia babensis]
MSDEYARARLREYLRDCEARAKAGLLASGERYSRTQASKACAKLKVPVRDQRIGDWLRDHPETVPDDYEPLWALVRVWAQWAGDPVPTHEDLAHLKELVDQARASRRKSRRNSPTPQHIGDTSPGSSAPGVTTASPSMAHPRTVPVNRDRRHPGRWTHRAGTVLGMLLCLSFIMTYSYPTPVLPTTHRSLSAQSDATGHFLAARFDTDDASDWPAPWTRGRDPGAGTGFGAQVDQGVGILTTSDAPDNAGNRISRRLDISPRMNAAITLSFIFKKEFDCFPQIFVRADNAIDVARGYALFLQPGQFFIQGFRDYRPEYSSKTRQFSIDSGVWYKAKLDVHDTSIKAKVWRREDPEPETWPIDVHDDLVTNPGSVGLTLGGGPREQTCSWTVDDVEVTP